MLLLTLWLALPVTAAEPTEFLVRTDRDTPRCGETITCTVSMGAVENLYGMKLKVNIPKGLTLVEGSGSIASDLQAKLNAARIEFVESTGVFLAGACHYSATSETELFQFQCVVNEDAPETMEIILEIDPENVFDLSYENIAFTTTSALVMLDDTCLHEWSDAVADEDNGHWFDCQLCDLSRIDAHEDGNSDGLCDICGYGTPIKKNGMIVLVFIAAVVVLGVSFFGFYWIKKRNRS